MSERRVWEETWAQTKWASVGDAKGQPHEWLLGAVRTGESAAHAHLDPELVARARLAAAAPDLARVLLAIVGAELLPSGLEEQAAVALRKAGVR